MLKNTSYSIRTTNTTVSTQTKHNVLHTYGFNVNLIDYTCSSPLIASRQMITTETCLVLLAETVVCA